MQALRFVLGLRYAFCVSFSVAVSCVCVYVSVLLVCFELH